MAILTNSSEIQNRPWKRNKKRKEKNALIFDHFYDELGGI